MLGGAPDGSPLRLAPRARLRDDPSGSAQSSQPKCQRPTRVQAKRLLGLIVYRYHARTSRYNGARKTELQAVWTATLVNLHPIGAALRAQTP
jgi:hypothetical protein